MTPDEAAAYLARYAKGYEPLDGVADPRLPDPPLVEAIRVLLEERQELWLAHKAMWRDVKRKHDDGMAFE